MTDFVNLKIKPTQSFKRAHKNIIYIYVFIRVNDHTCMNISIKKTRLEGLWFGLEAIAR
jgi:hypothetical protein